MPSCTRTLRLTRPGRQGRAGGRPCVHVHVVGGGGVGGGLLEGGESGAQVGWGSAAVQGPAGPAACWPALCACELCNCGAVLPSRLLLRCSTGCCVCWSRLPPAHGTSSPADSNRAPPQNPSAPPPSRHLPFWPPAEAAGQGGQGDGEAGEGGSQGEGRLGVRDCGVGGNRAEGNSGARPGCS